MLTNSVPMVAEKQTQLCSYLQNKKSTLQYLLNLCKMLQIIFILF